MPTALRKALATVSKLPAIVSIAVVRVYQRTLSPDHGSLRHLFPYGFCRHEPTCSQYAIDVLKNRNYIIALGLIVKRIASCNPWTKVSEQRINVILRKNT